MASRAAVPRSTRRSSAAADGEPPPILRPVGLQDGDKVYFYELHEGDDELYADVLLAHDSEFDEEEFLALVIEAREAVLARYEEDTLSEAIANELERRHGFLTIDDSQLRVSVNVSVIEGETGVVSAEARSRATNEDRDDEGFRSLLIEVEPEDRAWSDN